MSTADDYTAYIRSTIDSNGKAACLLQWGQITQLLTPETVLTTARDLMAAAAAAETDIALVDSFRATLKADMDTIGLMVMDIRKRRPSPKGKPALRIAAVAGHRTHKPYVHIARGSMKHELDPDEAREMALHWTEAAIAAQIDVRLRYALGEWDHLDAAAIERLFTLLQGVQR
ncbi:hypothetical protein [Streptomyces liliifuscus]|uniref:Uncharacterized protein n=1 Tax=Streptomyces liliifuscus TaxID=2797636 RepID=A0A7T7L1Z9_9ACTN|nr:hypothetical protein [Streptomyces liliifuscus]QQM44990.1 hypothetical protein JEQ17_40035 [Streptomyces liliifuscus]